MDTEKVIELLRTEKGKWLNIFDTEASHEKKYMAVLMCSSINFNLRQLGK